MWGFYVLLEAKWAPLLGLFVSIIPAQIWYSTQIMAWKIWAFSKVNHVHELRRKAVSWYILHSERKKSRWDRPIYWSGQREKWTELQRRFDKEEDRTLYQPYLIYHSRFQLFLKGFILLLLVVFGAGSTYYLSLEKPIFFLGPILLGMAVYGWFKPTSYNEHVPYQSFWKEWLDRSPQVQLQREGISIRNDRTGFLPWHTIRSIHIE